MPKPGSSLLRSEGSLLSFQRQFQDPMEKKPWGCAAFDPGELGQRAARVGWGGADRGGSRVGVRGEAACGEWANFV